MQYSSLESSKFALLRALTCLAKLPKVQFQWQFSAATGNNFSVTISVEVAFAFSLSRTAQINSGVYIIGDFVLGNDIHFRIHPTSTTTPHYTEYLNSTNLGTPMLFCCGSCNQECAR